MNTWRIGDVTITRVIENEGASDISFLLPDATPDKLREIAWLSPNFADEAGRGRMSVHSFVIVSQGLRIVVDTCIGNGKTRKFYPSMSNLNGPYLTDLASAGFPTDSVDRVVCTHLHSDHVGWNTIEVSGQWVPTFPNARYCFVRDEWEYCSSSESPDIQEFFEDSVQPVYDAGAVDLIDSGYRLTDEVWVEPTPGHTRAHHSVRIASRGEHAVIAGDMMHHPVQIAHPQWGSVADYDYGQAIRTRESFIDRYGDKPVLILGTHFATPSAGRIVKDGAIWRFDS